MKKYPTTIPYSSIDWKALAVSMEQMKAERHERERQERLEKQRKEPFRPYMDLSRKKDKLKDHTAQFREVYGMFEKDLKSDNQKTKDFATLKYGMVLKEIAGRPLKQNEIKMITIQCIQKNPRMRINAFGQLYTTKEETGKDVYTK